MKNKQIPYIDQLLELGKLYKVDEIKLYAKSKKKLTTSQIELILLKNKIRLPEQSYNKKKIAEKPNIPIFKLCLKLKFIFFIKFI